MLPASKSMQTVANVRCGAITTDNNSTLYSFSYTHTITVYTTTTHTITVYTTTIYTHCISTYNKYKHFNYNRTHNYTHSTTVHTTTIHARTTKVRTTIIHIHTLQQHILQHFTHYNRQ